MFQNVPASAEKVTLCSLCAGMCVSCTENHSRLLVETVSIFENYLLFKETVNIACNHSPNLSSRFSGSQKHHCWMHNALWLKEPQRTLRSIHPLLPFLLPTTCPKNPEFNWRNKSNITTRRLKTQRVAQTMRVR